MQLAEVARPDLPLVLSMAMKLAKFGQDLILAVQSLDGNLSYLGAICDIQEQHIGKFHSIVITVFTNTEVDYKYEVERFELAEIKKEKRLDGSERRLLIVPSHSRWQAHLDGELNPK